MALIIDEYDGFKKPETIKLDKIETWCQILKLPAMVLKREKFLKCMSSRIGKVLELQIVLPNGFVEEFIRVRVKLDVTKKLARFVSFTKAGATEFYQVKFKKLPVFFICVVFWAIGMKNVVPASTMRKICNGAASSWHQEEGVEEVDVALDEAPIKVMPLNLRMSITPSVGGRDAVKNWRFNVINHMEVDPNMANIHLPPCEIGSKEDLNVLGKRIVGDSSTLASRANNMNDNTNDIVTFGNTAGIVEQFESLEEGKHNSEVVGTPQKNSNKKK
ncbi:putative disease resistance protein RGA3 [Hordeum vulgare]|nr:putative disease resistance protein RGA3 [Hordeum vulgare]